MGGGGRHEHLASGKPQYRGAARRPRAGQRGGDQRRDGPAGARGVCLEDIGTHTLRGIAEPMTITRVRGLPATPSPDEEFVTLTVPVLVGREKKAGCYAAAGTRARPGWAGRLRQRRSRYPASRPWWRGCGRRCVRRAGPHRLSLFALSHGQCPLSRDRPPEQLSQFAPDDGPATRLISWKQGWASNCRWPKWSRCSPGCSRSRSRRAVAPLTGTPSTRTADAGHAGAWLAAQAKRQPVLAVWEDLHWADPTTLEMLGLVSSRRPRCRCCTS